MSEHDRVYPQQAFLILIMVKLMDLNVYLINVNQVVWLGMCFNNSLMQVIEIFRNKFKL
jgi:hypothetical protein